MSQMSCVPSISFAFPPTLLQPGGYIYAGSDTVPSKNSFDYRCRVTVLPTSHRWRHGGQDGTANSCSIGDEAWSGVGCGVSEGPVSDFPLFFAVFFNEKKKSPETMLFKMVRRHRPSLQLCRSTLEICRVSSRTNGATDA